MGAPHGLPDEARAVVQRLEAAVFSTVWNLRLDLERIFVGAKVEAVDPLGVRHAGGAAFSVDVDRSLLAVHAGEQRVIRGAKRLLLPHPEVVSIDILLPRGISPCGTVIAAEEPL